MSRRNSVRPLARVAQRRELSIPDDITGADAKLHAAVKGPAAAATLLLLLSACSGGEANVDTAQARGEKIYKNICATCHGASPTEAGTVGPAIAGSSAELIEAKLLHNGYPAGYRPKRNTKLMAPLPHLAGAVPELAAYLQSFPAAKGD
jgi:mono/diheme cytochrome c family protein